MIDKLTKLRIETQKQEAKIRALKIEKKDIDSSIRNSTKAKEVLLLKVKNVQKGFLDEVSKKKNLDKEVKVLEVRVKEAQKKIDRAEITFKNNKKQLLAIETNNDKAKSDNNKNSRDLDEREQALKTSAVAQSREIVNFEKEKARFKLENENAKKQFIADKSIEQRKLNVALANTKQSGLILEIETGEFQNQIESVNFLKKDLESKISGQKESTKQYTSKVDEYKNVLAALSTERRDAIEARKNYEEAKNRVDKREISFIAQQGAMDTKEKELEIAELRLKKLIQDKKIDTELRKLKETVK